MSSGVLFYDYETNGLLRRRDLTIHCMSYALDDGPVKRAVGVDACRKVWDYALNSGKVRAVCAHYGSGFDVPVTKRIFGIDLTKHFDCIDTKVIGSLVDPEYSGTHSLEDWGRRVGVEKDTDYVKECEAAGIDPWAAYTERMGDYCDQDIGTMRAVYNYQCKKYLDRYDWSASLQLETLCSAILAEQAHVGVWFDVEAANKLVAQLEAQIAELTTVCKAIVQPKCIPGEPVKSVFKKNGQPSANAYKALGLDPATQPPVEVKDGALATPDGSVLIAGDFTRVEFSEYDLDSRQQVITLLQLHGWKPTEYTEKGNAKFTEDSITSQLGGVGKALAERFVCITRLGQVRGWLSKVRDDGRIEARAFANATPTARCRHSVVVNVPRGGTKWGPEMRGLFGAAPGRVLVGIDAAGLELRMLAHYLNDPEFTKQVIDGDIHWHNAQLFGLVPKGTKRIKEGPGHEEHDAIRNVEKTLIYAILYGAGDAKAGSVLASLPGYHGTEAEGALAKQRFYSNLPAFDKMMQRIEREAKQKWLTGLDGRKIYVRHAHAALNSLLQSAGSIVVKSAMAYTHKKIKRLGLGARQVIFMHDEIQVECVDEATAKLVGDIFNEGIKWAEQKFKIKCPLDSEAQIGTNWANTH